MPKPFFMMFFAFVMGYTGYVFVASSPLARLDRTCTPFTLWPGRLVVAAIQVGASENAVDARRSFEHGFHICRRWLWNAFYEEKYQSFQSSPRSLAQGLSAAGESNGNGERGDRP